MMRFIRHLLAPVVAYMVAAGWLPQSMAHDVTEALVIATAFVVSWLWGEWNERRQIAKIKTGEGGGNA